MNFRALFKIASENMIAFAKNFVRFWMIFLAFGSRI